MTAATRAESALLRRGRMLEVLTLSWNVLGVGVLAWAAVADRSIAVAGFGLDSLIEIGASAVVLWELAGSDEQRRRRALHLIGLAFIALALYLSVQSAWALWHRFHPDPSPAGIGWTSITAVLMFVLAAGKRRTGQALRNPVLLAEGRVTTIDGLLAVAVLLGLAANAFLGWWWADPLSGFVLVYYAGVEAKSIFTSSA